MQHLFPTPAEKLTTHLEKLSFHLIRLVWFQFHIIFSCSVCSITNFLLLLGYTIS